MLWVSHIHRNSPDPPHPPGGPGEFLVHELGLDAKQQKQFDLMRLEHHHRVDGLRDSLRILREDFFKGIGSNNKNLSDSIGDMIGKKEAEIEKITFRHFQSVRGICTADQQKKFDLVIMDALKMMAPPPPGK